MKTPHLDHIRRFGTFPLDAMLSTVRKTTLDVRIISGEAADSLGSLALREIADSEDVLVLVSGPTDYHEDNRVTLPRRLSHV
jgi:hypothetical protein